VPVVTFSRGTLEPWYVTGLAEGEAVFTFSRSGGTLNPHFSLRSRSEDAALLEAVQAFFGGIGRLYGTGTADLAQGHTRARSTPQYRVSRLVHLLAILEHFEAYPLRGHKRQAVGVWGEMVRLKARNYRRPPLDRLEELAGRLSALTARGQRSRQNDARAPGNRGTGAE